MLLPNCGLLKAFDNSDERPKKFGSQSDDVAVANKGQYRMEKFFGPLPASIMDEVTHFHFSFCQVLRGIAESRGPSRSRH